MPLVGPTVVHALQANMLEQIRRDVIATADLASGAIGGTANLTVCFADLVEFTRLGEEIPAEELGLVAGRLEEMASAVAEPPVRLVKTIGDAVMFVSTEPEPMLRRGPGADRRRRGRRRRVPLAARRPRLRLGPAAVGRLLRPPGQPRQPHHRRRPPRQRRRRRRGQGGGRRGLRLHLHRRAPPQGHRLQGEAVPRPPARVTARSCIYIAVCAHF